MIVGNPDGTASADKDFTIMSKFLNRILGIPVTLQNEIFDYFTDNLKQVIEQAKKIGTWDQGILGQLMFSSSPNVRTSFLTCPSLVIVDLASGEQNRKILSVEKFMLRHATGSAKTELHQVEVERGMKWDEALERSKELKLQNEGFYISKQVSFKGIVVSSSKRHIWCRMPCREQI